MYTYLFLFCSIRNVLLSWNYNAENDISSITSLVNVQNKNKKQNNNKKYTIS